MRNLHEPAGKVTGETISDCHAQRYLSASPLVSLVCSLGVTQSSRNTYFLPSRIPAILTEYNLLSLMLNQSNTFPIFNSACDAPSSHALQTQIRKKTEDSCCIVGFFTCNSKSLATHRRRGAPHNGMFSCAEPTSPTTGLGAVHGRNKNRVRLASSFLFPHIKTRTHLETDKKNT